MTLTFYTNPNSRGRIVRWMLEEIGVPYETVVLDYQESSARDAWGGAALEQPAGRAPDDRVVRFFRDINPMGKVPAIDHDGNIVTEAGAICAYLAEAFPEVGLGPTAEERANYHRWMFFAAGPVEQAVTNHRAGFRPLPEQEFFFGYGSYERTLNELERAIDANAFIAGDRFTAADVYVGSHVGWGLGLQTIPPRDTFVRYAEKLARRDAYRRAATRDEQASLAARESAG